MPHENHNAGTRRVHGILDYAVGFLLIIITWLLGFANDHAEAIVPVCVGAAIILYSLLTNYESGIARKISMPIHLRLDIIAGIFPAVSSWLFDFKKYVRLPHLIVGLVEILIAFITERQPYHSVLKRTRASRA